MGLFNRQTTWDKVRAVIADRAVEWQEKARGAAASSWDAAGSAGQAVGDGVRAGAQGSASAVKSGAAAVGRGVTAVDDKVHDVANGVIAGAIAGALAAWVMNQYQAIDAASGSPGSKQATAAQAAAAEQGGTAKTAGSADGGENATVQIAEKVSREQFGHELTEAEKPLAGQAVHYGYGAAMGALYGGLTELVPFVGTGLGLPYATAMWLFGDEIAVSALGLGKPLPQTTPAEHATSLSAHFVYGVTLDVARRVLRHIV